MILKQAQKIFSKFNDIKYGFLDKSGKLHCETDVDFWQNFMKDYVLQTPEQVLRNKIGVCWDQVELSRKFFADEGIPVKTFFLCCQNETLPAHVVLTFEDGKKFYWIETSMVGYIGIHTYNYEKELISGLLNADFSSFCRNYNKDKLYLVEYQQPKYGIVL